MYKAKRPYDKNNIFGRNQYKALSLLIQNCIHNRYLKEQILKDAARQVHSSNATASATKAFICLHLKNHSSCKQS